MRISIIISIALCNCSCILYQLTSSSSPASLQSPSSSSRSTTRPATTSKQWKRGPNLTKTVPLFVNILIAGWTRHGGSIPKLGEQDTANRSHMVPRRRQGALITFLVEGAGTLPSSVGTILLASPPSAVGLAFCLALDLSLSTSIVQYA